MHIGVDYYPEHWPRERLTGRANRATLLCAALVGLAVANPIWAKDMKKPADDDWTRFDPRADDLEIEIVSERTEDGIKVTSLYYTSHKIGTEPVRIYGIYGRPAKVEGKIPAILFIHGGGQIADEPEVLGMARRGYACFSHDWKCADTPEQPDHPSRWPFDAEGKRMSADEPYLDSPAWIARRALTLLERQPEVDPDRMGVYGFSWGGYHTWTVTATDSRVKAANPSCGILWSATPCMDHLLAPVLFFDASEDFFARMDGAQKTMKAVNVEHRRLIAPNEMHNMAGVEWEATRAKWFDHYLKGGAPLAAAPQLLVDTGGEGLSVTVRAPGASVCTLIYSYGARASSERCWFRQSLEKTADGLFTGALPRRAGVELWYFANCDYADGTMLSTEYTVAPTEGAGASAEQSSRLLYDPAVDGRYPWYFSWQGPVDDHPWHSWGGTMLAVSPDVAGRPALHVAWGLGGTNGLGLFKAFLRSPACPLRAEDGATKLGLNVYGARPLRVTVVTFPAGIWTVPIEERFQASVEVNTGEGWAELELPLSAFQRLDSPSGADDALPSFEGVQQFQLIVESADKTRGRPAIGRIQWEKDGEDRNTTMKTRRVR